MKKAIKRIMFAITAFALCFAFTGCTPTVPPVTGGEEGGEASNWQDNMHREDNDFLEDDNRRPSREPFVDNTPDDDGDPVIYRFEAEAAKIRGVSNGEDHFCTAKSTEFSPDFSGNITLCNLGTATLSFIINSDKAVRSDLILRMANQYGSSTGGVLSAYADITVNDKPVVDLSASFDIESGEVASGCSTTYFKMITLKTKISLAQGKNVLSITPAIANYLNLDYIEIHTSAVLDDQTESSVTNPSSFVKIAKTPTETAAGQIGFVCHNKQEEGEEVACKNDNARIRTLPALTSDIYTFKELDNGTQHVVKMFGGEAVIVSTVVYNLTLKDATFADGSTIKKFAPGENPVIKYTVPEGKVFSHWEDGDGNNLGSTFVMPEKDITLKPVFIVSEDVVTLTLQGATLDGKNTVTALAGNVIDLSLAALENQPEGTVVRYWYDVTNITDYYEDFDKFTVPEADITLAPAFDNAVYANRDGSTTGKVATFPYYKYAEMNTGSSTQPLDGYIRILEASGVKGRDAYWGYVGAGDSREMGAVYHWKGVSGALKNGFHFTALSPYKVVSATKYTMTYTVQNQGTKEITLKIYQTNASGSPKPSATCSEQFTLAAGETKTVSITFTGFSNNNIMTTVELLTDGITDLHLGMYQYIEKVN